MVDSTVIRPVWSESSLYALWIAIQTQTFFMRTKARQNLRPAKTQISFGICPVWSESLLCAQWVAIRTQAFSMLTAKTLIRLGGCPGWSESSLGAQAILLVLLCCGSYEQYHRIQLVLNFCRILVNLTWSQMYPDQFIWVSAQLGQSWHLAFVRVERAIHFLCNAPVICKPKWDWRYRLGMTTLLDQVFTSASFLYG